MENLIRNIKFSIRTLSRNPGFTAVALIALALGIGANSAIFSVVNGVLLTRLPYKNPDRLAVVWETNQSRGIKSINASLPNFADWKEQNQVFDQMVAIWDRSITISGIEESQHVWGAVVSPGLFPLLGVQPSLGRAFVPAEESPNGPLVVILSHGAWQRIFGGDAGILGKTLTLNGGPFTVVGVMPAGFNFPPPFRNESYQVPQIDLWIPAAIPTNQMPRTAHMFTVIGRLKDGVALGEAQSEMSAIAKRLEQQYQTNQGYGVRLVPLETQYAGDIKPSLLILLGAVCFVLLVACANVANLMLARAMSRQKEMAIRLALGATRRDLLRQLLTESFVLAMSGGVIGMLLSVWGTKALVGIIGDPRFANIRIDLKMLGFTLFASAVAAILCGVIPALQATKLNLNETLKETGRTSTVGSSRKALRNSFVIAEVALALILLIGAGLMIRSFQRLQGTDAGFNPENVLTMQVSLKGEKYGAPPQKTAFFQELIERVRTLPGVEAVSAVNGLPLSGRNVVLSFDIESNPRGPGEFRSAEFRVASADYFATMRIPLISGRTFTDRDNPNSGVVIINETVAKRYWPNENPLGQRIKIDNPDEIAQNGKPVSREIIGVVKDVKHSSLEADPKAELYVPFTQNPESVMTLVIKTAADPTRLVGAARSEVHSMDRDLAVYEVSSMEQLVAKSISRKRFTMMLLGIFAFMALVLAGVGIYGVISYSVSQRTHEIGLRVALGAKPRDVHNMIVRQGMILTLIGVAIGLVGAFALTRVLSSLLYSISNTDPITFLSLSLLVAGVAFLASYIPARRATRLEPMTALRYK